MEGKERGEILQRRSSDSESLSRSHAYCYRMSNISSSQLNSRMSQMLVIIIIIFIICGEIYGYEHQEISRTVNDLKGYLRQRATKFHLFQ